MDERGFPVRLREVLDGVVGRLGLGVSAHTATVWARWPEAVGDAMALHVEPTSLRDGVLRVRADSPTWATEASYLAEEIQKRVNALVGTEAVDEVRVWSGPGGRRRGPRDPQKSRPNAPPPPPPDDPLEALERAKSAWRRRVFGPRRDRPGDEESTW
jgi:predicted nucleic acid-binding Zn ribbon protein